MNITVKDLINTMEHAGYSVRVLEKGKREHYVLQLDRPSLMKAHGIGMNRAEFTSTEELSKAVIEDLVGELRFYRSIASIALK